MSTPWSRRYITHVHAVITSIHNTCPRRDHIDTQHMSTPWSRRYTTHAHDTLACCQFILHQFIYSFQCDANICLQCSLMFRLKQMGIQTWHNYQHLSQDQRKHDLCCNASICQPIHPWFFLLYEMLHYPYLWQQTHTHTNSHVRTYARTHHGRTCTHADTVLI